MNSDLKENLKRQSTWKRGFYMLLFTFFAGIADFVLFGVVVFQFLHNLFTGEINARLLKLGQGLSSYIYQIVRFLTFNSEYHPYPMGDWPDGEPSVVTLPAE
ncbi:MAG: hypothetical protein ACI845_002940 [Gammaproteobacteria bacterium]|jgi:hypothetical protein